MASENGKEPDGLNGRLDLGLGNGKHAPGTARPLSVSERLTALEEFAKQASEGIVGLHERTFDLRQLINSPHVRELVDQYLAEKIAEYTKLHDDLVRLIRFCIDKGFIDQAEINEALTP